MADQAQQPNPAPVDPAPAPTAPAAELPLQPRRTRETRTSPPPTRLAYTRHATAGDDDDRIINAAWYKFLLTMLWIGGIGTLLWILFGGFQWGRATVPVVPIAAPVAAPSPTSVPVATPPQVVVVQVPVPQPTQVETPRLLTDAERRNEALKERLRRRYGIQ